MKEIALHILDIAENSIRGGAGAITITILEEGEPAVWKMRIEDDGKGMSPEELKRVVDPFFTSRNSRRVGMGIPLLKQHAEMAGGELKLQSEPGLGTTVEAVFMKDHPDRQPLGDIEGCWILLASSNPDIEWELHVISRRGDFSISTPEIKSVLGLDSISGHDLIAELKRMVRNNMKELGLE